MKPPIVLAARTRRGRARCSRCDRQEPVDELGLPGALYQRLPTGWWLWLAGKDQHGLDCWATLCAACAAEAAGSEGLFELATNAVRARRRARR